MGAETPALPPAARADLDAALAGLFGAGVEVAWAEPRVRLDELLPEERERIAGLPQKRQAEFSTGRVCARQGLARLGRPAVAIPSLASRAPAWPDGCVGSISHTAGCCAAAVAPSPPYLALGLDVESDAPLRPRVLKRVCTPEERDWLALSDPGSQSLLGKLCFSAKEAVYKCQHPRAGAALGFQDVQLRLDAGAGSFEAEILVELGPGHEDLRRLRGRLARVEGLVLAGVSLPGATR